MSNIVASRLTKYEITDIIAVRSSQISKGAPPKIKIKNLTCAFKIAEQEFKEGKIPFYVVRILPCGKKVIIDPNKR